MPSEEQKTKMTKERREFKSPYREDVIGKNEDKITIDWKKIAEMERTAREGTYSATLLYGTYDHLIDLGILSVDPKEGYHLVGSSVLINPRSRGLTPLYFTRKEDAEAFKGAMYGGALYRIDILELSS